MVKAAARWTLCEGPRSGLSSEDAVSVSAKSSSVAKFFDVVYAKATCCSFLLLVLFVDLNSIAFKFPSLKL